MDWRRLVTFRLYVPNGKNTSEQLFYLPLRGEVDPLERAARKRIGWGGGCQSTPTRLAMTASYARRPPREGNCILDSAGLICYIPINKGTQQMANELTKPIFQDGYKSP